MSNITDPFINADMADMVRLILMPRDLFYLLDYPCLAVSENSATGKYFIIP